MAGAMLVGLSKREMRQMQAYFKSVGVDCELVPTIESAIEKLPANPPTVVVVDKPDQAEMLSGLRSAIKAASSTTSILVALKNPTLFEAIEAMQYGAYDCLSRPFDKFNVLVAAKKAASTNGRTLFASKLNKPQRRLDRLIGGFLLIVGLIAFVVTKRDGAPKPELNLNSATLSGIQWQGRSLWVGNWMDSTVTHYQADRGFFEKSRKLTTREVFRSQETQPILVCNTPDALITVGFDLKLRSHQRIVGLPTLQTVTLPGSNPAGLVWDGNYLWSLDSETESLYKHTTDLRIIETVKCLLPNPVGLAFDGTSIWVVGGKPLKVARLEKFGSGFVWRGPYGPVRLLPEDVNPTGVAAQFGRLWMVSGGDPRMVSVPFTTLFSGGSLWPTTKKVEETEEEEPKEEKKEKGKKK